MPVENPPFHYIFDWPCVSCRSVVYGDLELFLSGLQLGDLIPVFQEQDVSFPRFLQLTDKDLLQVRPREPSQYKDVVLPV